MAGTQTAPAIDGTPTYKQLSLRLIDSDGTKRALDYQLPNTVTNLEMNSVMSSLQACTNASIYEAWVSDVYFSNAVATNAANAVQQSVRQNIVILFRDDVLLKSQEVYIPAPLSALFVTGTKNIDITNALYLAYKGFVDAALATDYEPVSVRYTERRQINQKQNNTGA